MQRWGESEKDKEKVLLSHRYTSTEKYIYLKREKNSIDLRRTSMTLYVKILISLTYMTYSICMTQPKKKNYYYYY